MDRRTRFSGLLQPIQLLMDIGLISASMLVSFNIVTKGVDHRDPIDLLLLALLWIPCAILLKPYRKSRTESLYSGIRKDLSILVLCFILIFSLGLFYFDLKGSEKALFASFVFAALGFSLWRFLLDQSLKAYRRQGYNYRNVFFVGTGKMADQMRRYFQRNPELGYRIFGEIRMDGERAYTELEEKALSGKVHEIYCFLPELSKSSLDKVVKLGEEAFVKVKLIGDLGQLFDHRLELEHFDHIPVLNVRGIPLDDHFNRILKRGFDLIFSSFIIVFVLSWAIPLIGLAIVLTSKGPVFFKQRRTGRNGEEFMCLKFRTMIPGAERMPEPSTEDDPRITGLGAFLRKSSMDELPQFLNVLVGDMSVVGPRPHMTSHSAQFSQIERKFRSRHRIKPGITGLAQAKGFRGTVRDRNSLTDRLKLDRFYLENWSLIFDLKIILLTLRSLVRG